MPRAVWKRILDGSIGEALLAVDLYNRPRNERRVEAFFVHMHLAWLYLFHAQLRRDGIDYRYRQKGSNRFERVDGEPKTWELAKCLSHHWPDPSNPVRRNIELTIALRNRIEHRFTDTALDVATSGYAQATLLNYERELCSLFGNEFSLAGSLRFPVFIGTFTQTSAQRMKAAKNALPVEVRTLIDDFQSGMDASTIDDSRYEFRINLVPQTGSKTEAELALNFVREEELTDEQKTALASVGRSGTVIVRERERAVASADKMKPAEVVRRVADAVPFKFNMFHFTQSWKTLNARPATGSRHPERTDERYCVYDKPHGDYVYTEAFVKKLIREARTEKGFRALTGRAPERKS